MKNKPNVLHMIDTYVIGGPGKVLLQFLQYGGKQICSSTVAGFWRGKKKKWQFRDAVEALDVRFNVLHQKFAFDPTAIWNAYKLVKEQNIQILESHGYKAHVVCLALKRLTGLPWVGYVHGWTSENLKVELYNHLDRIVVRYADRIVPVSIDIGRRLKLPEIKSRKLVNISNAAEPVNISRKYTDVRTQLGVLRQEKLLAVVGRLSPEKGHRDFIAAFNIILATHLKVKAVFIGSGQEHDSILEAIQQQRLEDSITLVGYQEDVSAYYHACDLLVVPSHSEGMPMVALEAMMFAKPVVATNVGGIAEVVLDGITGTTVPKQNPAALATAIIDLLSNPQKMRSFGLAGKERVEAKFTPYWRINMIKDMYQGILT